MANLNFKYGASYSNLPEQISNGTIYVTKNEKAMYVDLDGSRLRLGQTIVYDTWAEFNANVTVPPQSPEAFYYIWDQNALLKYNSTTGTWKQINSVSDLEADLTALKERVSALETTAATHTTNITNLQNKDTALEKEISDEVKARIDAIDTVKEMIADETNRAVEKENSLSGRIDGISSTVSDHTTDITTLKSNVITLNTDLNKEIQDRTAEITRVEGLITAEKARAEEAERDLSSSISDLQTAISSHSTQITALQSKDTELEGKIVQETTARTQAVDKLTTDLAAETKRATDAENGLKTDINAANSAISANSTNIANNKNAIDSLKNLVGTLPEGTSSTTVVGYIEDQFIAANHMYYKGGVESYSELPSEDVEAGWVYVVTADFIFGEESYYAGDLLIADQDQSGPYTGGWTHVRTGYIASQESKLEKVGSGNGIVLKAHTGNELGGMTISSDNLTISSTYDNASKITNVSISMEWGTF